MKVEATVHGDRKVYSVSAFNRGVADWTARLPSIWVEGEVTELRRNERWSSVFFTLKDPADASSVAAAIPRRTYDALSLGLADGERVHVFGRPEVLQRSGELRLRALSIERFGEGAHLAALERLKRKLADEGLFASGRKKPLPRLPRRIGIVTGSDAAAREAKGLDFKAPDGESPREVQARIQPLLARLAELQRPTVLVTHKAVIRALYALATGWTMIGKPPTKLRPSCAQLFRLNQDGTPAVERLNVSLEG